MTLEEFLAQQVEATARLEAEQAERQAYWEAHNKQVLPAPDEPTS